MFMSIKSKQDLVKRYNVSRVTFGKYINKGELYEKLLKTDYRIKQKLLTPLQVSIIVEHLGDFDEN
jgi:hypothetical protein